LSRSSDGAGDLAGILEEELARCRAEGARDVLVDLEGLSLLRDETIAVLDGAASAFHAEGGEFVVACEDRGLRERLAQAGLAGGSPEAPAGPALEGVEHVALPERPRWQHQFSFPAAGHELPNARRRIVGFAEICGMEGTPLFELNVAVGEALANALTHGSPEGADDDITVRFFSYPDEIAVEVGDQGHGMDAAPICAPSPTQPAGRGIHFMRTLADDMLFTCGPTGTRVLLVKKLR
jgi:anti-sigma regulatory factor (Ser/Thr protein kinase)